MKEMPIYPVYVISKGRADCCFTANFLIEDGVDFRIVVEPQEEELYAAIYGRERLLILPFSNLGLGGIPARNWVWEHAKAAGYKRHWILDDNIRNIKKYHKGKKLKVSSGLAFKVVEDFTDRYTNVALSGFNYSTFVGLGTSSSGQKYPPFHLNVHIYSALLILNSLEQRWRGRYNEDTDLCLQVLSDNWCTVSFNIFNAEKMATMTMKGGNTTELYKGDGRLKMARSLERAWPGVVETKSRYGRPQHHVINAWKKFDTQLIRRTDIDWDALKENPYKMELKQIGEVTSPRVKAMLDNSENSFALGKGFDLAENLMKEPQLDIQYPVYVLSKNRAESGTTARLLQQHNIPFSIVIEPQDVEQYLKCYKQDELIVMDKNDMGIDYVRNYIKSHSTKQGDKFHWQFDDDIKSFKFRQNGKNTIVHPAYVLNLIENVTNLYTNIGASAAMYDTWAFGSKTPIKLNKVVSSAILFNNDNDFKFEPHMIEDIDIAMQYLTNGYCTLLFATALVKVPTTLNDTGGIGAVARIGGYKKTKCDNLAAKWKGCFKVEEKNGVVRVAPSKVWNTFKQQPILKGVK